MAQGDSLFYRLKNVKLVPDNYGMTIEVKMVSVHNGEGKFIKNLKIDDNTLDILKNSWLVNNEKA